MNRARLDSAEAVQHLQAARASAGWARYFTRRQAHPLATQGDPQTAGTVARVSVHELHSALAALDRAIATD